MGSIINMTEKKECLSPEGQDELLVSQQRGQNMNNPLSASFRLLFNKVPTHVPLVDSKVRGQ